MSSTIHHKYKYFHSIVQTAWDRRQKFHFCPLPFDVTSCLIFLLYCNNSWDLAAKSSAGEVNELKNSQHAHAKKQAKGATQSCLNEEK